MKESFRSFYKQPLFVCMLVFFIVEGILSVVFRMEMAEKVPPFYLFTAIAADMLIPSLFAFAAYYFKRPVFAVFAVLSMLPVLFVKIFNVIQYGCTYSVFHPHTALILLGHTDSHSIRVYCGEWYFLWIPQMILLELCLLLKVLRETSRSIRRRIHPVVKNKLILLFLLTIQIAVIGYWVYDDYVREDRKKFHSECVARPAYRFFFGYRETLDSDIVRTESPMKNGYNPEEISAESREFLEQTGLMHKTQPFPVMKDPFTKILIIALESMDLRNLHSFNESVPAECTESLDRLSREYLSFRNFYTSSLPTSWGLGAMFLSRLDYDQDLEMQNPSVFDILKKHGFSGYYISPVPGMFADNRITYEKLFHPEHILFLEELHQKYHVKGTQGWGLSDQVLYRCAARILGDMPRDEKFFMTLSTVDSHPPYTLSGPLKKEEKFPSPFLNCLRCTDRNLNDFLNEIMRLPIFDERMLIIVTSDHSATHGENFHKRNDFLPDKIPLIFITKNNRLEKQFHFDTDKICGQTDLPVTLLNLLGICVPETFMGDNILTKKSFALTRSSVWLTLHLEGKDVIVNFEDPMSMANQEERSIMEYYNCFYGPVFREH